MNGITTGHEAKEVFCSVMKGTKRLINTVDEERTLQLITNAFKALAEGSGELEIGGKRLSVEGFNAVELKALCNLSRRFFETKKNLDVSGELLTHIEILKNTSKFNRILTGFDTGNRTRLDSVRKLIYLNECPEIETGSREQLQNQLRNEIKTNAPILKKMIRNGRIKRAAIVAAGVLGAIGSAVALVVLAATGLGVLGFFVFFGGISGSIVGSTVGAHAVVRKVDEAKKDQETRMWAFELLKDTAQFEAFCAKHELASDTVTLEEIIANRYKKAEVPETLAG